MFTRLHRAALCLALLVGAAIASHAQGASAASALVIDRAVYQAVDGAGSADVKDALSKLISGNTLTVVVGNDTLGCDPADGHVKRLHVEYTLSGKKYSQDVDEQGTLTIPDPKAIPLTGASPAPAGASLVIDRASYQAVDGAGSADVKAALSKLISGNALTVVVGNDTLGGDPADGHIKRLHVEYTLSGKKYSQDVDEQGTLTIPDPKATPLADASLAPSAAVLVIVRASYEALDGGGSADVKDLLSKLITGNRLTVLVSNDTLGGDPAANHEKRLHIEYTLDGKQYSRDVAEQGTLTIPDPNAAKPDAGK